MPPQPVGLRYFEPAPELRGFISAYYYFYADTPQLSDITRADLPQLRFMISGAGAYTFGNVRMMRAPAVSLIGPTMAASRFEAAGPLAVFGVGLLPAGWAALVREDAGDFADRLADAEALFGTVMTDALDAMRMTPRVEVMISVADAVLRVLAQRATEPPLWFTRMTDEWLTGEASPDVDALVARSDMSARQLERLARRVYGAPPKLLARKYRALRAASALGAGGIAWQDAAGDAFYDQSHFIREFKHFIGQTPRQFLRSPTPVTKLMLQRRELAGRMPELALVS